MSTSQSAALPHASSLRQKAEGAFIALAAGDALGWPVEFPRKCISTTVADNPTHFVEWVRRSGSFYATYEEVIRQGEYSDDTQLMLAVARSRIDRDADWLTTFTSKELPFWTTYARGGGGAVNRAARSWCRGAPPWGARNATRYFTAGGNGVAMRVLPHAIYYAMDATPDRLLRDVVADGTATHGHPRALVGAAAFAFTAWWLIRQQATLRFGHMVKVLVEEAGTWGANYVQQVCSEEWLKTANSTFDDSFSTTWDQSVQEMCLLLEDIQEELAKESGADDRAILKRLGAFDKFKGAGTITTAAAVYLVSRYAAQPTQAVLKGAFSKGADTDTLASLSGALTGCLRGTEWIPAEWFDVQDGIYIRALAGEVVNGTRGDRMHTSTEQELKTVNCKNIHSTLIDGKHKEVMIDGVGKAELMGLHKPEPSSNSTSISTWMLRIDGGQTIYITKTFRPSRGVQFPRALPARKPDSLSGPHAVVSGCRLLVHNLREATYFYENALGLKMIGMNNGSAKFPHLELIDADSADYSFRRSVTGDGCSLRGSVVVSVGNAKQCMVRVRKSRGKIVQTFRQASDGQRSFVCQDPDGNLLSIVEEVTASATASDDGRAPVLDLDA